MLNKVWSFVVGLSSEPPVVRKELPQSVKFEVCRFLCALPLAQMNLRTPVLGGVTASDASETGGGFCVSRGLTPMGVHAAQCSVRGDMPELEDFVQVLTLGLCDGVGALRVAADGPQLPMGGHISAEVSVEGSRVLEWQLPGHHCRGRRGRHLGRHGAWLGLEVLKCRGCLGRGWTSLPGRLRIEFRPEGRA